MSQRRYVFKHDELLMPGKVWVFAEVADDPHDPLAEAAQELLMPRVRAGVYTRAVAEADPILAEALRSWDARDNGANDERERRWIDYAAECDRLEGAWDTASAKDVIALPWTAAMGARVESLARACVVPAAELALEGAGS
ncbi:MAG: hypothetical protein WDA27_05585 [Actinomycetota bacterium]